MSLARPRGSSWLWMALGVLCWVAVGSPAAGQQPAGTDTLNGTVIRAGASPSPSPVQVTLEQVIDHAHAVSLLSELAQVQREAGRSEARQIGAALQPVLTVDGQLATLEQTTTIQPNCFNVQLPDGDWDDLEDWDGAEICLPPSVITLDSDGWSSEAGLALRWVLWPSPLVRATRGLADLSGQMADVGYDRAMGDLTIQVVELYYGVLQAQAAVNLLELALSDARLELEEREWQLHAGTASQADYLQSLARVMELEGQVIQAEGALDRARLALNHVAGYPLDAVLVLQRPTDAILSAPTLWEALKAAQNRPDIQEARMVVEQAQAYRDITRAQSGPTLQLFGSVQGEQLQYTVGVDRHGFGQVSVTHSRSEVTVSEPAAGSGDQTLPTVTMPTTEGWMVGIRGSWSLMDGGESAAKIQQAEAQARAAELHLELLLSTVESEVRQAEASLKGASGALDAARKYLDAMTEAFASMEEAYRRGAVSERSLSQVGLAKAQAHQALIQAESEYMKALVEYRRAAGLL